MNIKKLNEMLEKALKENYEKLSNGWYYSEDEDGWYYEQAETKMYVYPDLRLSKIDEDKYLFEILDEESEGLEIEGSKDQVMQQANIVLKTQDVPELALTKQMFEFLDNYEG